MYSAISVIFFFFTISDFGVNITDVLVLIPVGVNQSKSVPITTITSSL